MLEEVYVKVYADVATHELVLGGIAGIRVGLLDESVAVDEVHHREITESRHRLRIPRRHGRRWHGCGKSR